MATAAEVARPQESRDVVRSGLANTQLPGSVMELVVIWWWFSGDLAGTPQLHYGTCEPGCGAPPLASVVCFIPVYEKITSAFAININRCKRGHRSESMFYDRWITNGLDAPVYSCNMIALVLYVSSFLRDPDASQINTILQNPCHSIFSFVLCFRDSCLKRTDVPRYKDIFEYTIKVLTESLVYHASTTSALFLLIIAFFGWYWKEGIWHHLVSK